MLVLCFKHGQNIMDMVLPLFCPQTSPFFPKTISFVGQLSFLVSDIICLCINCLLLEKDVFIEYL